MSISVFDQLLSLILEAGVGVAKGYINSVVPLGNLIRAGDALEMSGNQILAAYRSVGGSIATQTFFQIRRQVLGTPLTATNAERILAGDTSLINLLPGGKAGTYRFDFQVFVNRTGIDGLPQQSTTMFTVIKNDFDPQAALDAMGSIAANFKDPNGEYGKWVGFELSSVSRYKGK